jgi:PAS domain S-box-containing protein
MLILDGLLPFMLGAIAYVSWKLIFGATFTKVATNRKHFVPQRPDWDAERLAMEVSGVGCFWWYVGSKKVKLDKCSSSLFGFENTPGHVRLNEVYQRLTPQDLECLEEELAQRTEDDSTGIPFSVTVNLPSGESLCVQLQVTMVWTEQGVLTSCFCWKVENQKVLREELRQAYSGIDQCQISVMWVTQEGRIVQTNPFTAKHLGYTMEEMQDLRIWDIDSELSREVFSKVWSETERVGGFRTLLRSHTRKDGTKVPVEVFVGHIKVRGELYSFGVSKNIEKRMEDNKVLEAAKAVSVSAEVDKANLLTNMSRVIRSPLNAVIGLSALILRNVLCDDEQRSYVEKIQTAGKALQELLDEIVDFNNIETGNLELCVSHFNLQDLMENLGFLFSIQAGEKGVSIVVECSDLATADLLGDALRIRQILTNLMSNAVKFTVEGEVTLTAKTLDVTDSNHTIYFCVQDTGVGMNDAAKSKLFRPFSQADASIASQFGGTGLGMTIAQRLLKLHGGNFTVDSTVGVGTSLSFVLRLKEFTAPLLDDICNYPTTGNGKNDLNQKSAKLSNISVLVAEDNAIDAIILREMVRTFTDKACIVTNGFDAVEAAKETAFDVILMDILMPKLTGIEATREIRASTRSSKACIIAITAGATAEERKSCLESGMDDVLLKPLELSSVVDTLEYWMRMTSLDSSTAALRRPSRVQPTKIASTAKRKSSISQSAIHTIQHHVSSSKSYRIAALMASELSLEDFGEYVKNGNIGTSSTIFRDDTAPTISVQHETGRDTLSTHSSLKTPLGKTADFAKTSSSLVVDCADMECFDFWALAETLGTDEELVGELLREFKKYLQKIQPQVVDAAAKEDNQALRRLIHDIAGASGGMCARKIYRSAERVQAYLHQNVIDASSVENLDRYITFALEELGNIPSLVARHVGAVSNTSQPST